MKNFIMSLPIMAMVSSGVFASPVACLIEPEKVAELGTSSIGIIDRILVERGDYVQKGQVVALLKSDVERASVHVATARAEAEADLKAALVSEELAQAKLKRAHELFSVGFISKDAVEQADADARVARNRVVQAREAKGIARNELELSKSQLEQRKVTSPFSGIVIDRYRAEGERIEREPVLRIAKVDPLRVEAILPATYLGQIKAGTSVPIRTEIAGLQELTAKVVLVDTVIDAASNTFRVRMLLPNQDRRVPAGLRCKADFAGQQDANSKAVQQSVAGSGLRLARSLSAPPEVVAAKRN